MVIFSKNQHAFMKTFISNNLKNLSYENFKKTNDCINHHWRLC